jgi:hypothetical protein
MLTTYDKDKHKSDSINWERINLEEYTNLNKGVLFEDIIHLINVDDDCFKRCTISIMAKSQEFGLKKEEIITLESLAEGNSKYILHAYFKNKNLF